MKDLLWDLLRQRLNSLLNQKAKVPDNAKPYLTLKGFHQVLKKALDAVTHNKPSQAIHLSKQTKKNTDDRTAEIVLMDNEYQLLLNPNNKLKDGTKDSKGSIGDGGLKTVRPAVRLDKDSPPLVVAKLALTRKPDLSYEIDNETQFNSLLNNHNHILTFSKGCEYQAKDKSKHKATLYAPRADSTLKEWIKNNPTANYQTRLNVVTQIAQAVVFMHAQKIVHGDLADFNVVMFKDTPKIIDFGCSQFLSGEAQAAEFHFEMDELAVIASDVLNPNRDDDPQYTIPFLDNILNRYCGEPCPLNGEQFLNKIKSVYHQWEKDGLLNDYPKKDESNSSESDNSSASLSNTNKHLDHLVPPQRGGLSPNRG